MKYIFALLLVFSFNLSFGQMTLNELMRVYNMNFDQFETFAISKGYEIYKIYNDKENSVSYTKGYGKDTKYLALFGVSYNSFNKGINVSYQTGNPTEYLKIKNEMKNLGFKLFDSYFSLDSQVKEYRNNKFQLIIYTIPPKDNNSVHYEINLQKY